MDLIEDELLKKHKQERKDLQSTIQSLKRSVAKGDKKKKKEIAEEIARLEDELDTQQASELQLIEKAPQLEAPQLEEPTNCANDLGDTNTRTSRAQKRRNKKAQEDKDREKRILDQEEKNKDGPRVGEMNAIKDVLRQSGLQLHNIPADGNCLYCAVNHQLDVTGRESFSVAKLRKLTAEFMRENRDDFIPFMYDESDEPVSEKYFEDYCKEVEKTKLWGGQLELKALSNVLTCPIKVIQASGPPTLQGEHFKGPELILTYHRHLYRLGEHYNSTTSTENQHDSEDDE